MLKQFKIITLAPTCFGSSRNHHQGAVLCLVKITKYGFTVLVGIDAVRVMAAYQPVAQDVPCFTAIKLYHYVTDWDTGVQK
jgi:hypothetical protein